MSKPPIGRLTRVDLREAFEGEATHFTPWLAGEENIGLLGDALGLDLEVEAQERNVGPFRADILCKNAANDSWVLVENQLERTDHVHLGQLLTYAAGLEAVTIVWVAKQFTEEHRATLDWLNAITDDHFNFFGIEVELFQIGDSAIAPHFNVVSKPNDWSKTVTEEAKRISSGEFTPTKQRHVAFWTGLREYAEARGSFLKFQKPQPQNWTSIPIGRSRFHLDATVSAPAQEAAVQLIIQTPFPKADFRQLLAMRAEIEGDAGGPLDWRELPERIQSRVDVRCPADFGDETSWPKLYEWFVNKLELMHKVFGPRVKALKLAESADAGSESSASNE